MRTWIASSVTLLALCVLSSEVGAQGGSPFAAPDRLATLKLDTLGGQIVTHRSPGVSRAEAAELQGLLTGCLDTYRDLAPAVRPINLAVLGSAAWIQVADLPYGLPHTNSASTPILIVVPATAPRLFDGLTGTDHPDRLFRLLGLHELGHVLTDVVTGVDRRIDQDNRFPAWYYEFAATYFALSCLSGSVHDRAIIRGSEDSLRAFPRPAFTKLNELETLMTMQASDGTPYLFTASGAKHFAWYQRLLNETAARLEERLGRTFVTVLRSQATMPGPVSTTELVTDLARAMPALEQWLRRWGAL